MEGKLVVLVSVIFGGSILGVFLTKTEGFGKYTTSVLLLMLVLYAAVLSFILGKIDVQPFSSILFAVAGYAGGLVVGQAKT